VERENVFFKSSSVDEYHLPQMNSKKVFLGVRLNTNRPPCCSSGISTPLHVCTVRNYFFSTRFANKGFAEHSSPENSSPDSSSPEDSSLEIFFPGGGRFFAG
jgi:hypothetical protein